MNATFEFRNYDQAMTNTKSSQWLSACLLYNEPWETFLFEAVKPLTDVVLRTGIASNYFFSRHWHCGPHIRLHFKGDPALLTNMLQPHTEAHFNQYFLSKPSVRLEPHYPSAFPAQHRWLPNNSVQFLSLDAVRKDFDPFLSLDCMEDLLQQASTIALSYIRDKGALAAGDDAPSLSTKLQFGLLYASGMELQEVLDYYKWAFQNWIKKQVMPDEQALNIMAGFRRMLTLNTADLEAYHAALWELMKRHRDIDDEVFSAWIAAAARLFLAAMNIHSGDLKRRQLYFITEKINNLLGINGKKEGYQLYTLSRSLPALSFSALSTVAIPPLPKEKKASYHNG